MICAPYLHLAAPRGRYGSAAWEAAFAWLKNAAWKDLPPGTVDIDGRRVYASVTAYGTRAEADTRYEVHQHYADIQLLAAGEEEILVCHRDELAADGDWDDERDLRFLRGSPRCAHRVVLAEPLAAVFLPEDAHRPCIAFRGAPAPVRKVVVKVRLA